MKPSLVSLKNAKVFFSVGGICKLVVLHRVRDGQRGGDQNCFCRNYYRPTSEKLDNFVCVSSVGGRPTR